MRILSTLTMGQPWNMYIHNPQPAVPKFISCFPLAIPVQIMSSDHPEHFTYKTKQPDIQAAFFWCTFW